MQALRWAFNKGAPIHPGIWRLLPVHIEFLLLGWIVQLVFSVAFWILPRFRTQRRKPTLVWLAYSLLNGGIWLVVVSGLTGASAAVWLIGRSMDVGAVAAFAIHS